MVREVTITQNKEGVITAKGWIHKVKYRTNRDPDSKFHTTTLRFYRKMTYSEVVDEVTKKVRPAKLNFLDVLSALPEGQKPFNTRKTKSKRKN